MQNGNESFRKGKSPLTSFLLWVSPPNPGSPCVALCYSFYRILLKLHGLHDLCNLPLGPTYCSMESLGKVLGAHGTLEAPHLTSLLFWSILTLPNTFLLAFHFVEYCL